ncbi:MAG TPA: glycosyltransferase [Bryobacteraceae bacterium]|nr:glycosyltransferase [Bryobacteraceae bacterium]
MIWVFALSALAATYILAGWPLLLGLIAHWRARPIRRTFRPRSVSVILAVHNGDRYLRAKLDSIFALDYPRELLEVIVVSDGSTDATDSIAAGYPGVQLRRVPKGGKCRALNAGVAQAHGEILFFTDVRQMLDPACLKNLIACFHDPEVGVASGELRIRLGATQGAQDVGLYWRFETWIRDRLSEVDSLFGATGAIYTMRRELAVEIPEGILLDDMYLPLAAYFKGYRLVVAHGTITWDDPTSRHTEFQRKVRTLAGNYQLLLYYPQLLLPFRNRMWLHYMSYKLGRLMLPWIFTALFLAGLFLPQPWKAAVLAAQLFGYGIVLLDPYIGENSFLKRISSPTRTFAVMMAAAVLALRVFFVDPRSLWIVTSAKKETGL